MVRKLAVIGFASLGAAIGFNVACQAAPPDDKSAIQALEDRYVRAFTAEDVNAVMASYAPSDGLFVFDAVPPRQYAGWDAYKKDWQALFAGFPGPAPTTMSDLAVTVVGPVAYGHNIQTTDFTTPKGQKERFVARVSDVYRKVNGEWKIVQEHVSFPVDVNTGKADLLSKP